MPGLAGIACQHPQPDRLAGRLATMQQTMPVNPAWLCSVWTSADADCTISCFPRDADHSSAIVTRGDLTLALDGELYGVPVNRTAQAETLLQRFSDSGVGAVRELEGRFVVAIWNDRTKQLTLLTDKFASKPVYYLHQDGAFAFCTSVNALRESAERSLPLNRTGVIQFFTFGHLWNDDTFYESVKAAEPAAQLNYDGETNSLSVTQYWRPRSREYERDHSRSLNALTTRLAQAVEEQSENTPGLGVALSGGLDARTMLALIDTQRTQPACVSLGMEGSLDQKSARRLAELAGCKFHSLILGEGFLEDFRSHLLNMVRLTDGHYLSQCIVMPTFPLYEDLGVQVLLRGHAGELVHMHKAYNFSIDSSFGGINSPGQLENWLAERLQSHLTAGVPEPLLNDVTASDFAASGRKTLQEALTKTAHFEHPLDRTSQLFLDQRTRRETAMSLVKFNSVVDTRVPYLDSRFIDAVFSTPPELRSGETVQTHILRARRPEFLSPANSNTGAPVGVSTVHRTLAYWRMRVFAKLGFKGYQPYERLGLWLRRELSPLVKEILLDPQCLDRGLLNPDCVHRVVHRHLANEANHTYLLMAMMVVELGLRDGAPAAISPATADA